MCKVLDVSRSGYYKYIINLNCRRKIQANELLGKIIEIYNESKGRYGSPRIHQQLKSEGVSCNHKTVEKLMAKNHIRAKRKKQFRKTTNSNHNYKINKNHLNREFSPSKPNQVWCSDITYVRTSEGWLYLCVFIDLFSKQVLGWSIEPNMKSCMVIKALKMAIFKRNGKICSLLHSDRGVQYASDAFRSALKPYKKHCKQSMSDKRQCSRNAPSESFFSSLKNELIHLDKFKTKEEAKLKIFEYIEVFYNRQRLHSALEYLSPINYEKQFFQVA